MWPCVSRYPNQNHSKYLVLTNRTPNQYFTKEPRCVHKYFFTWWSVSVLTQWGRNKMTAISQTTFPSAFSWTKLSYLYWNFTDICFEGSNYQYTSIGSDDGLLLNRWQAIIWTSASLVFKWIYASIGLNESALFSLTWFQWMGQRELQDGQYVNNTQDTVVWAVRPKATRSACQTCALDNYQSPWI